MKCSRELKNMISKGKRYYAKKKTSFNGVLPSEFFDGVRINKLCENKKKYNHDTRMD